MSRQVSIFQARRESRTIGTDKVFGILLGPLLFISVLNARADELTSLGFIAIFAAYALGAFNLLLQIAGTKIDRDWIPLIISSCLFIAVYSTGLFVGEIDLTVKVAGSIVFFVSATLISYHKHTLSFLGLIAIALILSHVLTWGTQQLPMERFHGWVENPNMLGTIVYLFTFFVFASRNRFTVIRYTAILIAIFIIFISTARSVWIACFVTAVIYLIWPFTAETRKRHIATYLITVISTFIISIGLLFLVATPLGSALNELSREYTGKFFFTGREYFWYHIFESIKTQPWLGYGGSLSVSDIIDMERSSHNTYIQTTLQVGLIGLFAFYGILGSAWMMLRKRANSHIVRLSGAYLIGLMIHLCFEVRMTQTNLAASLVAWTIIAIGVSTASRGPLEYSRRLQTDQSINGPRPPVGTASA